MKNWIISVALVLLPLSAFADTVNTGVAAQWNTWNIATEQRIAGFWDGGSDDGANCNIGFWFTATNNGGCYNIGPGFFGGRPGAMPFLSALNSPQTPVTFTMNPAGGSRVMTLRLKVAGWRNLNEFGYYLLSSPGTLNPLFQPSDEVGRPVNMMPTGPFAFYIKNASSQVFTSQSHPNFALFSLNPASPTTLSNLLHYWIGVEDMPILTAPPYTTKHVSGADADYNDLVVDMNIPPPDVPPSSGCTLTMGGYKNNFQRLVKSVTLGTVNYSVADVLRILNNPVRGNGLISLAHQLITAKLNIMNGAVPPQSVLNAINAADQMIGALVAPPVGSGSLSPSQTSSLTQTLDNFNNGLLGVAHCP